MTYINLPAYTPPSERDNEQLARQLASQILAERLREVILDNAALMKLVVSDDFKFLVLRTGPEENG